MSNLPTNLATVKPKCPLKRVEKPKVLSTKQQTAVRLLHTGKTIAQAARSIGMSRAAVYYWLRHDPVFLAAFNQWRDDLEESARCRLLTLADKATTAIEVALDRGDAKSALHLLKGLGIIRPRTEAEKITDPDELARRDEINRRRRNAKLAEEEATVQQLEALAAMNLC